jgi:hypothetical protein
MNLFGRGKIVTRVLYFGSAGVSLVRAVLTALACGFSLSGCAQLFSEPWVFTAEPLKNLVGASTDSERQERTVSYQGGDIGLAGMTWGVGSEGVWSYDSSAETLTYSRNIATVAYSDFNFFPSDSNTVGSFGDFDFVEVDIRGVLYDATSEASCGLAFGFGQTSAAHPTHPDLPISLRIGGRDYSAITNGVPGGMDFFRISYQFNNAFGVSGGAPAGDKLKLDLWINAFSDVLGGNANLASEAIFGGTDFHVQDDSTDLDTAEEWASVRMRIDHLRDSSTLRVTVTPLAASEDTSAWVEQTVDWDYSAATTTTVGGQNRSGIDLTGMPGVSSYEQFRELTFALGFSEVVAARICEFSNLRLGIRYRLE